jgi:hypothetical protein
MCIIYRNQAGFVSLLDEVVMARLPVDAYDLFTRGG